MKGILTMLQSWWHKQPDPHQAARVDDLSRELHTAKERQQLSALHLQEEARLTRANAHSTTQAARAASALAGGRR